MAEIDRNIEQYTEELPDLKEEQLTEPDPENEPPTEDQPGQAMQGENSAAELEEQPVTDAGRDMAMDHRKPEAAGYTVPNRGNRPTAAQLEQELYREQNRHQFGRILRSTIYVLITVAAVAVLIATLVLPVLKIYGNSMTPTLQEGEIVVAVKNSSFERGDIIAFYYNNRILVKRVICGAGDWFDMDEEGKVRVNGELLDEPYVKELSFETCDLELPYQVPDGQWFVMGDHRATSVDSRSSVVGGVAEEQIVGRIIFSVWPLDSIRVIQHK